MTLTDWPKTKDGRLICSPAHPMPIGDGDAHGLRWAHTNLMEVLQDKDGWPMDDTVTKKCRDCGIVITAEVAQ